MFMPFSLSLPQRAIILVAIPLIFEATLMIELTHLVKKAEQDAIQQKQSKEILSAINYSHMHFYLCIHHLISYYTTRLKKYKSGFDSNYSLFRKDLEELESLLSKDESRCAELLKMREASKNLTTELKKVLSSIENPEEPDGIVLFTGLELNRKVNRIIDQFFVELEGIAETEKVKNTLDVKREHQSREKIYGTLTFGLTLNVLIAALLVYNFERTISRRFRQLIDNSIRLATGRALHAPMQEVDELGTLDRNFHSMAATLTDSLQRERALLDNATDVICSLDSTLSFMKVNPAVKPVWGFDESEILGRRLANILDQECRDRCVEALIQARESNEEIMFESKLNCKERPFAYMLWSARWSEAEQAYFCVVHDITERKKAEDLLRESEERVRALVRHLPVGVLTIDESGTIESANTNAETLLNYSNSELMGRPVSCLFTDKFLANTSQDLLSCLMSQAGDKPLPVEAQRQEGELIPVEISITSFEFFSKKRYLLMIVDMTERVKADQLKRDFVAMVSHDLRTPLTSVRSFIELSSLGTYGHFNEIGKERLMLAESNLDRLLSLVTDLLDLEKLESGMMDLNLENVDAKELAEAALGSLKEYAEKSGIRLELSIPSIDVRVDRDRMTQVLINLISNAIKFSPANSIVNVTGQVKRGLFEFSITDSGSGIPAHTREIIFERFKQMEKDRGDRRGSGLGLAIAKAIVTEHGGKIGVDSVVGKGSTFWIQLPL